MATVAGNDGVIKVSTNTVLSVTSWSLNINSGTVEDTAMGDAWTTFITESSASKGIKSWDGTLECRLDGADATGQEAMTAGDEVELHLLYDGTSGYTGTAIITSTNPSGSYDNTAVSRTITFVGNGALADE